MRIAALETSGSVGSVALADDERLVAEASFERGMVHGRELLPALQRLLAGAGWSLDQVEVFAVSQGPGSYTGLRVGIATARTLAWATGARLLGVCTLDALSRNAPPDTPWICPALDARWEQVYAALYRGGGPEPVRERAPAALAPQALADDLPPGTLVFGSALDRYRPLFAARDLVLGDPALAACPARTVARLALDRARRGEADDPHSLAPLYLRPTEAEVKFGVVPRR